MTPLHTRLPLPPQAMYFTPVAQATKRLEIGGMEHARFGATAVRSGSFMVIKGNKCLLKFQSLVLKENIKNRFFDPFSDGKAPLPSSGCSTTPRPCPGTTVYWALGAPFLTYPFALHDTSTPHKPKYTVMEIDGVNSLITIRSDLCNKTTLTANLGCPSCQQAGDRVTNAISKRASSDHEGLQIDSLSISQAAQKIKDLNKDLGLEELKVINKQMSVDGHVEDKEAWKRVWELIATKDVPALNRIFRVGWKYNWSVDRLLAHMHLALEGGYEPYSFSKLEFDLAAAIYEIGGGAALYALHKSPYALPCKRTIQTHRQSYHITISNGKVRISDIMKNIEVMFKNLKPRDRKTLKRVGITLMMDEIASDGRLCYMPVEDTCVGLCEHAADKFSKKMGDNLELIEAITAALREGTVHIGQEILVVAFARNDTENYAAMPVLVFPTCKSGTALTFAMIIEMCKQAWRLSPYGEALHGPLLSIASDGDPKRRPSLYLHCMVQPLPKDHTLFSHLGELRGLNLMTGTNFETHDLDYKHTFKRICKLLCTREGILINGTTISKDVLWHWLEKLEDVDWTENTLHSLLHPKATTSQNIDSLLNPKDPQDVPRAIKLLVLVSEIRNLDTTTFSPSELATHRALSILGEMLHALIEPFINPKLSLAQQIASLVKFAHIACALYRKHEQHFMPHHLYSDLQSMVKTAVFRVAHTLDLDPELCVLLCLLGDDVLEELFGRTRMIGGHAPNVAVDELCVRFASAIRLAEIFRHYPKWEQRPERLKLIRNRDFDHLTPRDWNTALNKAKTLGGGKLKEVWDLAVKQAEDVLKKYGMIISFSEVFEDGVDLMRPIPGKKYPGISAEVDRSIEELVRDAVGDSTQSAELDLNARYEFRSWDGKAALDLEREDAAAALLKGHSVWITIKETKVHKKTVVRVFMDPTLDLDYNKSADRLLRVRCFSIGGDKRGKLSSMNFRELPREDVLALDDLFATLVSIKGGGVSLAIAKCVGIKAASERFRCAPLDEVSLVDTTYEISGQILSLVPFTPEDPITNVPLPSTSWAWNGAFISLDKFDPKAPKQPKATVTTQPIDAKANMVLSVNGSLVRPLSQSDSSSIACSLLPDSFLHKNLPDGKLERTYIISEDQLCSIEQELHQRVMESQHDDDSDLRARIPMFGLVREGYRYPYAATKDDSTTIVHATTSIAATAHAKSGPQPCGLCVKQVSPQARQNHVGKHILFKMRGVSETCDVSESVSVDYPCGFCGLSTLRPGGCTISIVGGKAISSCKYAYKFIVSIAAQHKPSKPCTNVPIKCGACNQVHWKYNMRRHLDERHPGWRTQTDRIMEAIVKQIEITDLEEERLKIPEGKRGIDVRRPTPAREIVRMAPLATLGERVGDSPRRPRHAPPVTQPPDLQPFVVEAAQQVPLPPQQPIYYYPPPPPYFYPTYYAPYPPFPTQAPASDPFISR